LRAEVSGGGSTVDLGCCGAVVCVAGGELSGGLRVVSSAAQLTGTEPQLPIKKVAQHINFK
jgi:hypothetical protein